MSGAAKGVAEKVASDLQTKNYVVTLAGIKSFAATNTTDYTIIVLGGPVYAGSLTSSIKDALNKPQLYQDKLVGVFGSGQGPTSADDIAQIKKSAPTLESNGALSGAVVVKIGTGEILDVRVQDFVNQLTK